MIYIVHIDAWHSEKKFHELTDEEIVKMYEEDTTFIDCYNSVDELAAAWNIDQCFYQNMSYMRVINEPKESFEITSVSREDLESAGFDTSDVDDSTMERLASKMGDAYVSNGFWIDLPIIAEYLEIPKKENNEKQEEDEL